MMIFNSSNGDPMLLDSVQGLRAMRDRFESFLASISRVALFPAITSTDPDPYDELLLGLRVIKDEDSTNLSISDDRWLVLSAPVDNLEQFCKLLSVERDGAHHHWYSKPVSLIIEADNWRAENES
jgi:hypothetical protein